MQASKVIGLRTEGEYNIPDLPCNLKTLQLKES